jgi:DNA-binding CsgD family transcriptional regulator
MNDVLDAPDLDRVLSIVEACERPNGLHEYRATALDALATTIGFDRSTFFLTGPPEPVTSGTDGIQLGFRPAVMEQYVEDHAADPFRADVAVEILRRDGVASLDQLGTFSVPQRRYVDEFLAPNGIQAQLCLWLDTGEETHGILCVLGAEEGAFGPRERALLLALRPHLANLLRHHVRSDPARCTHPTLSEREREVAALVARGRTNAEIARDLGIGEDTVKKHVSRAFTACDVRNRTELSVHWRA